MGMDSEPALRAQLKRFKAKAGPVPKRGQGAAPENEGLIAGVTGLSCALLVAMDCGAAPWMGQAIESIAPYGRSGMAEAAKKEVQGTLQAFLKLHQSSQQAWRECQEMLTPAQFDLLNEYKGGHSYFS